MMYVLCGRKVFSRITVSSIHLKCLTSLCIRDETLIIFILDSEVVFRPAFLTISSPHIPSSINIYAIYVCVCTKDSAFCLLRVYNGYVCLFVCCIIFFIHCCCYFCPLCLLAFEFVQYFVVHETPGNTSY